MRGLRYASMSRPSPNLSSCSNELLSQTKFPKAFLLAFWIMFCFNKICTFRQRQSILKIMDELEGSWYDEDDASEVEEDLDFENVSAKKDGKKIYKSAQCPECKKVFTQKSSMKLHLRTIHQGIKTLKRISYKPAQCPECKKMFTQKPSMKLHLRTIHHKDDFKHVQCPKCEKVLSSKTSLTTHLKSVRPCTIAELANQKKKVYKSAQCPECEKVFTQSSSMNIHLRSVHQGIRLKCEYCSKTATNKSNLQKHIRLYCQSKQI